MILAVGIKLAGRKELEGVCLAWETELLEGSESPDGQPDSKCAYRYQPGDRHELQRASWFVRRRRESRTIFRLNPEVESASLVRYISRSASKRTPLCYWLGLGLPTLELLTAPCPWLCAGWWRLPGA